MAKDFLVSGAALKQEELELWQKIIDEIKINIPETAHTWLNNLEPALPLYEEPANGIFLLKSNQGFGIQVLTQKYLSEIEEALFKFTQLKRSVRIILDETKKPQKKKQTTQKQPHEFTLVQEQIDNLKQMHSFCGLNLKYTFDNFVCGENSNFAYNVAKIVAQAPGQKYNPLYIHGNVGLGKTHLMQAIGHEILKNFPALKVKYAKAEEITNQLTESGIVASERNSKMKKLRDRYRNIDVLLLDDIQFAEGKQRTEEEIFNIFDVLFHAGKQIVFASDRPPSSLVCTPDRLKSRYEWGINAEILIPDLNTRFEIIKKHAHNSNFEISDDVAMLLAKTYDKNIRELEGAYNKLSAYASIQGVEADVELAVKILNLNSVKKKITVDEIIDKTAKFFGIKKDDILSCTRSKDIANARRLAMFLSREITQMSLPEIGNAFNKNHTTVIYSCEKVKKESSTNQEFEEILNELNKFILS